MSPQCRKWGFVIAAAAILLLPAFSQTTPTDPSDMGIPTTGTPNGGTASGPYARGSLIPNTNLQTHIPLSIRVSGRVMLDDGTVPSASVAIERVCNGTSHSEGHMDGSGYFSVQLSPTMEAGDASETTGGFNQSVPQLSPTAIPGSGSGGGTGSGRITDNRFADCELRARLGGYRSQSINLANRGLMDNQDVGVILIHRMGQSDDATIVTATSLKAPKAARNALRKGLDLAKKNRPEEAIASLQEAVRLDPEFAFAWSELAKLQMENGHAAEAHRSFEAAAKAEPRWPEPYLHLALLAVRSENWKEVADVTDRVLQLDSFEYPQAFFFNAVANYNLKHPELAEKSARWAQKLDTQHQFPQVAHLLGTILAESHRYAEAADEFRTYLMLAPRAADAPTVRNRLDDMEKLARASSQVARKEQQ